MKPYYPYILDSTYDGTPRPPYRTIKHPPLPKPPKLNNAERILAKCGFSSPDEVSLLLSENSPSQQCNNTNTQE